MRAVQIENYGDADALVLREADRPAPGAGQVLVKVHAASVNPFDCKIRAGWLAAFFPLQLPHTIGTDFAGEVVELGSGVAGLAVGERVFGMLTPMHGGTYAEYLVLDAGLVRPAPAKLSFIDAAALPLAAVTAMLAVDELAQIQKGQTILIHGAGGGVGAVAVQIAKHRGAIVFATCGTDKVEMVRGLGADHVIDYSKADFRTVAKGVDAVIDPIGGEVNQKSFDSLRAGGVMIVVLRNDPVEMQNRERLAKERSITVKEVAFDLRPDLLDRVRELADSGVLLANVQTVLGLDGASEAHRMLQTGHARGKIVLRVL